MRIRDMDDAERMARQYKQHDEAVIVPTVKVGRPGQYGVTGEGMDGIEASYEQLRSAAAALASLESQLHRHRRKADQLTDRIWDGTGPVAVKMAELFHARSNDEEGLQGVIDDYIVEVQEMRAIISETLGRYEQTDEAASVALRQAGQQHGLEA